MNCEHTITTERGRSFCSKCNKTVVYLSSTSLGNSPCMLRFHRTVVLGYRGIASAARLIYGIAVHKFIDTMFKVFAQTGDEAQAYAQATKKAKEAFALPKIDDNKSMHLSDERHLLNTCYTIWSGWITEDKNFEIIQIDNKPLTEQTFEIHFYEDDYIIVYLSGTIDKIGQFRGGCYAIGDWKTTSAWDNKGYFQQYELSRQLRMYRLACVIESERAPESTLGKVGATNMGVFIDAIFLKPNANENLVRRSDVFQFRKDDIDEFREGLILMCKRISNAIFLTEDTHLSLGKEGIVNGTCEGKWGKCQYWHVCANNERVGKVLLDRDFIETPWKPSDYNSLGD